MAQDPEVGSELEELESSDVDVRIAAGVRPGTDANVAVQIIVGVLGTIAVAALVTPLKGTRFDYLFGLIRGRGPIQYIELFMAFMVAAQVILKIRILRTQLRVMAESPIDTNVDLNDDVQIQDLRKQIVAHPLFAQSVVLSRMERLLAMWLEQKDVARISNWATAESSRDSSSSDSSYALARVLIWAIPILGFIGTVQGLGGAVSGFSNFLAGAAELSQIKDAIANVTVGLGVAFDTTFLALMLVTFLMFPLSSLQRREENLFVEIDIYLDDNVISRFPSPESKPIVIENLEDSIEAAFRRYIPDPDRYDEVFTRSIERAAGTVEEKFSSLIKNYEVALRDLSGRLSTSLGTVGESMEVAMQKVAGDVRQQGEELLTLRRQMAEEEVAHLKSALTDVNQAAEKIAEEYRRNAEGIQAVTKDSAEKSLAAAGELAKRVEEVTRLASGIQDLLRIEEAVEKGLAGIASATEFQATLQELRQHLATTDAFCSRLSKPRVITLREEIR
jgi:biopolymer transport protein ExbB/TolQ